MSARRRRKTASTGQQVASPAPMPAHQPTPMPSWNWRTFPVYFAFAIGGFIGLYMGVVVGYSDNSVISLVAFSFWAILLGWGFSRLTTRWLMSKNWGPAARRANKRR